MKFFLKRIFHLLFFDINLRLTIFNYYWMWIDKLTFQNEYYLLLIWIKKKYLSLQTNYFYDHVCGLIIPSLLLLSMKFFYI